MWRRNLYLPPADSLPKWLQGKKLIWSKAKSFLWVSEVDVGSQKLRTSSTSFLGHNERAGLDVEQPGVKLVPILDGNTRFASGVIRLAPQITT